jgi:uncharacterized phage protein (TIGR01671 family)
VREIMREYKFRGKRIDNGEWVYGYYFIEERDIEDGIIWRDIPQIQQRYGDHFQYFDVDLATVGQYTGLHDKNGREIFEGDIVKCINYHGEVIGHIDYEGSLYYLACSSGYSDEYLFNCKDFEVIGNIYDNPELLKEGSV